MSDTNNLAADLAEQTEQDDPTMIIVQRTDLEEMIAVVRAVITGKKYIIGDMHYEGVQCAFCGVPWYPERDETEYHAPGCEIERGKALLARIGVTDG